MTTIVDVPQRQRAPFRRLLGDALAIYTHPRATTLWLTESAASWPSILRVGVLYLLGDTLAQGLLLLQNPQGISLFPGTLVVTLISLGWGVALLAMGVASFALVARFLRGTGSTLTYSYVTAIILAVQFVGSDLLRLLPTVGGELAYVLMLYSIFLVGLATVAIHNLPFRKTILVLVLGGVLWLAFYFVGESSGLLLPLPHLI